MNEIARRAGLSEGTIYNYFENRDALMLAIDALNETEKRSPAFARAHEQKLEDFLAGYLNERLVEVEPYLEVFRPSLSEVLVNQDLRGLYQGATLEPTFAVAEACLAEAGSDDS